MCYQHSFEVAKTRQNALTLLVECGLWYSIASKRTHTLKHAVVLFHTYLPSHRFPHRMFILFAQSWKQTAQCFTAEWSSWQQGCADVLQLSVSHTRYSKLNSEYNLHISKVDGDVLEVGMVSNISIYDKKKQCSFKSGRSPGPLLLRFTIFTTVARDNKTLSST